MADRIVLTGKEPLIVDLAALVGYRGRKFTLVMADWVEPDSNYWSGGSKSDYTVVRLSDMEVVELPDDPTGGARPGRLQLPPGFVVIEHVRFQGKDLGLRIFVNPLGLDPRLLPAGSEALDDDEVVVLQATRSYKSSYAGQSNYRYHEARRQVGITLDRWNAAVDRLKARKLLNKAGAITVDGRNAVADTKRRLF